MAALPGGMENVFSGAGAAGPKPVLEFKAGKMTRVGRMVTPDKRKGMVQVWYEDQALHLKWKDRRTGTTEDDIFLFPGEATWKKVDKCSTGRVYALQFIGGDRVLFFWMQEPKDDKDAEYAAKINRYIEDPMQALRDKDSADGGSAPPAGGPAGAAGRGAGGANHQQQMELLDALRRFQGGQMGGAPGGAAPGGAGRGGGEGGGQPPAGQPQPDLAQMMQMLQGAGGAAGGGAAGGGAAGGGAPMGRGGQAEPKPEIDLDDLLSQEEVRKAIQSDPKFFEDALKEHFPEGVPTTVLEEIRSPQFRQTLQILGGACRDPDALKEMVTAFGLPPMFDPKKGGVEQLLNIILHQQKQKEQLSFTKVGAELRTVPPGKNGKYWGAITEVKDDGTVTVDFKEVGAKSFNKAEWEKAPKEFREPEPPKPEGEEKEKPDEKEGDGDAMMN